MYWLGFHERVDAHDQDIAAAVPTMAGAVKKFYNWLYIKDFIFFLGELMGSGGSWKLHQEIESSQHN